MLESYFQRVDGGPSGRIIPPPVGSIEIVDADSIKLNGILCRIEGYDAPEIKKMRSKSNPGLEYARGWRALKAFAAHLQRARVREVQLRKARGGGFGRDLVRLLLDGTDIAETALKEGWGCKWVKGQAIDWGDDDLEFPDHLPLPSDGERLVGLVFD